MKNKTNEEINQMIKELTRELYEREQDYWFTRQLVIGWFWGEYERFKKKTEKMILSTYQGGDFCNASNYKFSIIDSSDLTIEFNKNEISKELFNDQIIDLYKKRESCKVFADFIRDLIINQNK